MTQRQQTELPPSNSDFARLKLSVMSTIDTIDRRRTRKHRVGALGIAGILAIATTAGAIAITRAPQSQINYTADCYASANLGARHGTSLYLPGDQTSAAVTPLAERIRLAENMCAATWRIGTFQSDKTPPAGATFPVPRLVTCQLPDARLAVFPSTNPAQQVCSNLGLATPHD